MAKVWKIAGAPAEEKYRGSGYALACIVDGGIVDIAYARDIVPEQSWDEIAPFTAVALLARDPRAKDKAVAFERRGCCVFGMCSSWEFVEL